MSSILVLAQEPGSMQRIHDALGLEGWRVRLVQEPAQALQVAALEAPDLVIVSAAVAGAGALAGSFSRRAGGPGLVGLLPEGLGSFPADEVLAQPFSDDDLRTVVRRALAARQAQPAAPKPKLTSHDIFGDVLADLESAPDDGAPPPVAARPAPPPVRPAPPIPAAPPPRPAAAAPAAPAPATSAAPAGSAAAKDEINRRLEETLSGVLGADLKPRPQAPAPAPPPPRPAAPPQAAAPAAPPRPPQPTVSSRRPDLGSEEDLDAILSKTLSSLDMSRPKPAAPPAASRPAIPVAPPPSAAPPASAAPASPKPPAPPLPAPAPPRPAESSGPRPVSATAPAGESTGVRKAPKPDLDLSAIEELARTRRQPAAAPFGVRTEPIQIPQIPQPPPSPQAPPEVRPAPVAAPPRPAAPAPPPVEPPRPAAPVSVMPAGGASDLASTQRISVIPPEEAGNQPGEPFGQYNLLEKIAVGGMAEVWKARMRGVEGFQKMVAIKKILPHMSDNAEFIGMFIDEAKLAAQLSHPNIVHIYDLGKIGRSYYIAMEYVEGKDLRSLLNAGRRRAMPLPRGLALLIAARLASALDYAHRKRDFEGRELGLVHRDVSPQNVLISDDGDVKLCDFGIAKAVSKVGQTQMGALKGKLQYMSPEQAWGRAVDARSDIFSLGGVLFEMLTGERLFTGDSEMSVLESVRQGKVRSPREIDPSLPADVDDIVNRALAPIQGRFQTAGEMSQRIESVLHGLYPSTGPSDLAAYIKRLLDSEEESDDSAHFLLEPAPAPRIAAPAPPAPTPMPVIPVSPILPTPQESVEEMAPVAAVAPLGEVRVEETGRKGRGLLYAAILILLLAIVATFFFLNRKGGGAAPPSGQPTPAAPSATTAPPPGAAPGPQAGTAATPVDVHGLVGEELKKKQEEIAKQMQAQYEAKAKDLEKQIADAKKNGKPLPAAATPAPAPPAAISATATAVAPPPAQSVAAAPAPAPAPVQEPPRPAPQPEPEPPKAQERPAPAPAPAPAAEAPRTHTGDLVAGGPGVSPPELVSAPKPEYPPQARRLQVQGMVVVSVLVDENGRVQDARLIEGVAQKVGINEAALQVARNAQYKSAVKDGVRVKMWTRMRIPFKL